MKVLICAGGTGGGIYPGLAAAAELRRLGLDVDDLRWVGTRGEMEESLVPRAGLKLELITGGAIAGVPLHLKAVNGVKLAWGVLKAAALIRRFGPEVIFMTGGYVAVPTAAAARLLGVPVVIYLPDVEPGAAIKFALGSAAKVACTTEGSQPYVPAGKMTVTGYPVRPEIRAAARLSKADALTEFDLDAQRPTLFVFGGSRGASSINQALMAALPVLLDRYQVIHIAGTTTWKEVEAHAATLPEELRRHYRPFPYLHEEMGAAFRAADLVVARAGASMLGECPAFGLPAILVPYPYAWRYQKVNADFLSERGAAKQILDERLQDELLPMIVNLLDDEELLAQMGAAAKLLDMPDAAVNLAKLVMAVGQKTAQGVSA